METIDSDQKIQKISYFDQIEDLKFTFYEADQDLTLFLQSLKNKVPDEIMKNLLEKI